MKKRQRGSANGEVLSIVLAIALFIVCIAAWFTHIITCFTDDRWGFLIAGALFFPVAIFHGVWVWFT